MSEAFDDNQSVLTEDGKVVVTQAFCHNAHNLINQDVKISGYPSINLVVSDGKTEQMVYISSVQGDQAKKFDTAYPDNTLLTISCPICKEELDNIAPCDCTKGSKFVAIYLNKKRSFSGCVGVCNSWNCYRSFMGSAWRIISRLADKIS